MLFLAINFVREEREREKERGEKEEGEDTFQMFSKKKNLIRQPCLHHLIFFKIYNCVQNEKYIILDSFMENEIKDDYEFLINLSTSNTLS